jgi:hypothetical protein
MRLWILLTAALAAGASPALAQYPGHTQKAEAKKPPPPRAVSVLEWVGEPGKPKASRIVPVAVFVDGRYQDGGLYLARPAPLAVESDTAYELQKAGVPEGFYDLSGGQNVGGSWFGIGTWRPLTAPKPPKKLPQSRLPPRVVQDNDPDRPHFKGDATGPTATSPDASKDASKNPSQTKADPDAPTLHRRTDGGGSGDSGASGGGSANGDSASTQDDPDKPTLHRRSDSSGDTTASGAGTAPDDPDRPHMKKHSTTNSTSASADDVPSIGAANEDDPDRPKLSRGKPASTGKALEATELSGLPPELQQMAAVSDASSREEHSFAYSWANPDDAAKMKTAMEALAVQAALPASPAAAVKTPPAAASRPGAPKSTLARRVGVKPPPVTLSDEDFRAYELSYGGGATLVLTATAHVGPNNAGVTVDKYVTIIAQPDFDSVPQIRFKSVTTQADLDITPRMRLVDAVDTDGDNRAELVFELRRTNDRQFAIYSVRGAKAEQAFATEPLPYGSSARVEVEPN